MKKILVLLVFILAAFAAVSFFYLVKKIDKPKKAETKIFDLETKKKKAMLFLMNRQL